MNLKEKTFSSVRWTAISNILGAFIYAVQLSILARFLSPKDFGLVAITTAITGYIQVFSDLGTGIGVIHKQDITKMQLSSLYWLNVVTSIILSLLIILLAPLIADFYNESELLKILAIAALIPLIQSVGMQYNYLLQKNLEFDKLAKIDILSRIVNFIISILLALKGYGAYSLVFGLIAMYSVSSLMFIGYGIKYNKPSFVFKFSEIKDLIRFGVFNVGMGTVNYFGMNIDTLLIGKMLGTTEVGIFFMVKKLVLYPAMIINPIITKVLTPVFSTIQNDIEKLKVAYLKTINYLSSINFFIYMLMFVFSYDIILFLYGKNWLQAVVVLKLLSIWGAIRSTGNPIGSLIFSRGRTDLGFYWNVGIYLWYIPFLYIGSLHGLVGLSIALIVFQLSLVVPNWYFLIRSLCGASFWEYHKEIIKPTLLVLVVGVILCLIYQPASYVNLIFSLIFAFGGYIMLQWFLNKDFLRNLFHLFSVKGVQK